MFKPISSENITKSIREKLYSNGYIYVYDLRNSSAPWVKNVECEINENNIRQFSFITALDACQNDINNIRIKTGCLSLDECLGGGVPCGRPLEVCGAPAQGKTQLCLQLSVCVQLPKSFGGLEGESLYIDTAANFTAHRLKEIAECYAKKLTNEYSSQWDSKIALKKVHYLKALSTAEFLAATFIIEKFIEDNPQIKLIIIDDISSPFKDGCSDIDRVGILYRTMALLNRLAYERNLAVVVTNEVNMRLGLEDSPVGALGDSWAHLTRRLLLAPPLVSMRHSFAASPIQIGRQGISDCTA